MWSEEEGGGEKDNKTNEIQHDKTTTCQQRATALSGGEILDQLEGEECGLRRRRRRRRRTKQQEG